MKCTEWIAKRCQKDKIWKVHSVYKKTVNIIMEDRIAAFHSEETGVTPLSIQLPLSENMFSEFAQKAEKTGYIFLKEETVAVGTRSWSVGKLKTWNAELKIHLEKEETGLLQDEIEKFLFNYGKGFKGMSDSAVCMEQQSEDDLLTAILREKVREISMWGVKDIEKMTEYAAGMIGLGIGLTPSGDDFLTGMLLAFHLIKTEDDTEKLYFFRKIRESFGNTNDISRQYLECALRGEGSAVWHQLFQNWDNKEKIKESLKLVKQIGHSSGIDTLNGIAVGLRLMKLR